MVFLMVAVLAANRFWRSLPPHTADGAAASFPVNVIFNGDFGFWTEPSLLHNTPPYSPFAGDWHAGYDGSNIDFTLARQVDAAGRPYLHWEQHSPALGQHFNNLEYFVPGANTFANHAVTLSFRARCDKRRSITARLLQDVQLGKYRRPLSPASIDIGEEWGRYTANFFVPALDPKTIAPPSYLMLFFELPLNESFTFDITGVQLEQGSQPAVPPRS